MQVVYAEPLCEACRERFVPRGNRAACLLLTPLLRRCPQKASRVKSASFSGPAYGERPEWLRVGVGFGWILLQRLFLLLRELVPISQRFAACPNLFAALRNPPELC